MAYIAPIHSASSIRNALKAQFMKAGEDCLVVGKSNRLEIYTQSLDGLVLRHSKAVYGKITVLQKLYRPDPAQTDLLFIGTDRCAYFTASWDADASQLRTERKYIDLSDSSLRDAQNGDRCLIDPSRGFLTLEVYEGVVTIIPLASEIHRRPKAAASDQFVGSLGEPLQVRIEELLVRSSAFLDQEATQTPRMALLYEDTQGKVKLKLRDLKYTHAVVSGDGGNAVELKDVTTLSDELDLGASILIPVPRPLGGLLILGESSIKYVDVSRNETISRPLAESTVFVAWEQVDGQRWLLADDYGRLFFLMLVLDADNAVETWKVDLLGETSRATVLVYLDGGVVFIGSHQGDSQVIQITEGKFEVIQTISNIAPILDFTVMDMGDRSGETMEFSSGQTRIVTGSGAFGDGSLRSVRSGVGIEDLGVLANMEHITDLWGLRVTCPEPFSDTLLVSFVNESRVFHFSPNGDVEEKEEFLGLIFSQSTLLAANIPNNRMLQVTENVAQVIDLDSGMVTWTSSHEVAITSASTNDDYLVLVLGGVELICVSLLTYEQVGKKSFEADNQVSGMTIPASPTQACIVCLPQSAEIVILDLPSLEVRNKQTLGEPGDAIPRAVIVAEILYNQPPTLLVSMADGTVFSFCFNVEDFTISSPSKTTLGSEQPSFKKLPRGNGQFNVFATCDHPSLIYASEDRIVYSAVDSDSASRICSLNTRAYPRSIALSTKNELKIAIVDEERTTQIHTLPMHATVRRIAYSSIEKAFGLGTVKRTITNGVESVSSAFILADEILFRPLSTFDLNPDELIESVIQSQFADGEDEVGNALYKDLFFVGTAYLDDVGNDNVRGRILVFEVNKSRELSKLTEMPVSGACRALALMENNMLVAALVKTVIVCKIKRDSFGAITLVKGASYRTSTAPIDIAVTDNVIAVADLMKSVSLVQYNKAEDAAQEDELEEMARHYQTLWTTAVAPIGEDAYLVGDAEGNLIVLHRNLSGVTAADKKRLQATSEIRLGEMVNRIHPVSVQAFPNAAVTARAMLATVDGSIYLFGMINPDFVDLLMRLQAAMASITVSPGEIPFTKYRAFRTTVRQSEEPFRFVDGELIEKFLACTPDVQEDIVSRLDDTNVTVGSLKEMIEELRRMH
ncbi:DNA damage-binding protein 1a [Arthroderma uncinatum]|uniref:DNA damage-binding protein 1a n=1 Tax=Arthroderma uncinatum TaxID=74035 RepID=UPI00144AC066|nr:DNA damage-binding protein 1a [Arthroderma uncinatum]KAF3484447.1 DNA damage-binding protein 1a [Arthroderma uncinatum]